MANCLTCTFAEWDLSKTGRLSPTGDGRCKWDMKEFKLPESMYLIGGNPKPCGGWISRKSPCNNCPQYTEDVFRKENL